MFWYWIMVNNKDLHEWNIKCLITMPTNIQKTVNIEMNWHYKQVMQCWFNSNLWLTRDPNPRWSCIVLCLLFLFLACSSFFILMPNLVPVCQIVCALIATRVLIMLLTVTVIHNWLLAGGVPASMNTPLYELI